MATFEKCGKKWMFKSLYYYDEYNNTELGFKTKTEAKVAVTELE